MRHEDGKIIFEGGGAPPDSFADTSVITIDPERLKMPTQADVLQRMHDRDLAEFIRLTKLGYRFVRHSPLSPFDTYIDPFATEPVRFKT